MIPDYQTLMRPVLECAVQGPRKISEVVEEIANRLSLTQSEREELLPSGKQTTLANRVHWAKTYLKQAGLVRATQRGWYELTEAGSDVLADPNLTVDNKLLEQFEAFHEFRARRRNPTSDEAANLAPDLQNATPDETLRTAHKSLEAALAADLLDQVRNASPAFFETMIVELLVKMGYGGSQEEAGRALGRSGDNGVDGVIDQDPLGVDQIYLQAKRYGANNSVGPGEIRDFFGALSLHKALKGIFVTTSQFSTSATQTARDLGSRIVLIDGERLAKLMMLHHIGCREVEVLRINRIDEGYFDETLA